jgi:hypothetical protein
MYGLHHPHPPHRALPLHSRAVCNKHTTTIVHTMGGAEFGAGRTGTGVVPQHTHTAPRAGMACVHPPPLAPPRPTMVIHALLIPILICPLPTARDTGLALAP